MKFRLGQRVVAVVDADAYPTTNVKGTIVDFDVDLIGVEFDEDVDGHTLRGMSKQGYGLWCVERELRLLTEPIVDKEYEALLV